MSASQAVLHRIVTVQHVIRLVRMDVGWKLEGYLETAAALVQRIRRGADLEADLCRRVDGLPASSKTGTMSGGMPPEM